MTSIQELIDTAVVSHIDGRLNEAFQYYQAALELDTGNTLVIGNLAELFRECGYTVEAAEMEIAKAKLPERETPDDQIWRAISKFGKGPLC